MAESSHFPSSASAPQSNAKPTSASSPPCLRPIGRAWTLNQQDCAHERSSKAKLHPGISGSNAERGRIGFGIRTSGQTSGVGFERRTREYGVALLRETQ